MEHPLIPSLDSLTTEELQTKISELHKKLSIAYNIGNHHLCNQIRMAIESYDSKYQEKLRGGGSTPFDEVIDIS
jgi:hypothetical protein